MGGSHAQYVVGCFLWALTGLGIFIMVIALRSGRARGRWRCSGCWYDFEQTTPLPLMCPECGRTHESVASLSRTRRKWGVATSVAAVLVLMWVIVPFWNRLSGWVYVVLPRWKTIDGITVNGARVLLQSERDPEGSNERILISKNRQELAIVDWGLVVGTLARKAAAGGSNLPPPEIDLTEDGVPDLVVESYSGGAHCCWVFTIVQVGDAPAIMGRVEAANGGKWQQDAQTGRWLLVIGDSTFDYWNAPHSASPIPRVVLGWSAAQGGPGMVMQAESMRTPALTDDALRALADTVGTNEDGTPDSRLWGVMLDLIYGGHWDQAFAFLEQIWRPDWGDKAAFRADFEAQLRTSPYWREIARMNNLTDVVSDAPTNDTTPAVK